MMGWSRLVRRSHVGLHVPALLSLNLRDPRHIAAAQRWPKVCDWAKICWRYFCLARWLFSSGAYNIRHGPRLRHVRFLSKASRLPRQPSVQAPIRLLIRSICFVLLRSTNPATPISDSDHLLADCQTNHQKISSDHRPSPIADRSCRGQ